ncbi:MAG: ABC transporter ATP-binding protein, partial [Eubacterium sp.]|nr:ABC transporter ATP-binding protein [Eubacterium sp.]
RWLRRDFRHEEFWALQDISFALEQGDVLGIIGHNGAGKSTMLKVVSGIMKPTKGIITTQGMIVPMLELGSGFDMELSGRENIFLNGAILGYSKAFLNSRYEEIVAFSELENFIEAPLRTYSSGMLARLAFSVACIVEPEILIVDEILSVGDADFQEKSRKRMMQLMAGGTTVFFVSHSVEQIREMCNKVLWMEHGRMVGFGDSDKICNIYERC